MLSVFPVDESESYLFANVESLVVLAVMTDGLKPRPYLARRELLLIDEGYAYSRSDRLCRALREQGFSRVHVFRGGLKAWRDAIGPLQGDSIAAALRSDGKQILAQPDLPAYYPLDESDGSYFAIDLIKAAS